MRQEVILKTYPTNQIRFYNGARIRVSPTIPVYLTRDRAGVAKAFCDEFKKLGLAAELLDITDAEFPDQASGLVIIPNAFDPEEDAGRGLADAFNLARKAGRVLMDMAERGSAFFTTVTFSGGSFGFQHHSPGISPVYGGLAGLAKTADIEWKKVLCHALDLPADPIKAIQNAEAAVALMMTHGAVEMGLDGDHCCIPELKKTPLVQGNLSITSEDVVLITGGAKGVTAECALALAQACSPKIALLGRSQQPFDEPAWLSALTLEHEIKQGVLTHEFKGKKVTPAALQTRYLRIISNRAVKANLDRIGSFAEALRYDSVDIRDASALDQVVREIRSQLGPISVVIHGAGVLEDKLIVEKRPEQFERVFATKVKGFENLMAALSKDSLSHVVFFSSVAARFGNQGQCDYAMANEVLNKLAQAGSRTNPRCRYISVNWGPWDGGMVNDGLKREFSKRGIDLIPQDQGARQLVLEMGGQNRNAVEVVIGAALKAAPPKKQPVLNKVMEQVFSLDMTPVVSDHRIDSKPVVPLAMMAELMAHTGQRNNPGLVFAGIDGMHLLKGILPGNEAVAVRVELGKCSPGPNGFHVEARLVSVDDSTLRPHARGTVLLRNELPPPPVLSKAAFMDLKPCRLSAKDAYANVLFHGSTLQCITEVKGVSPKGIEVSARCRPQTAHWYAAVPERHWVLDPLMLDAAFQTAILWTYETRGRVCLPNAMDSLRIYASFPERSDTIRILFTVNHDSEHCIQGYFTFLGDNDTVIASVMGFEALTDQSLLEKFKPGPLFDRDKILAFAEGKPSDAFGKPYEIFDNTRQIARLPRPPYFFMDRVVRADHTPWKMAPGGWIETEYDIPQDAWYFTANRSHALPFCILLEIALQPCGWLAAYAGSALSSEDRLHFRNLGGKATLIRNLTSRSGRLTVKSRMSEVSKAGGMIIQNFDLMVLNRGETVYQGTTNFGFFTREALSNQVGIRNPKFHTPVPFDTDAAIVFGKEAPVTPDDFRRDNDTGMPSTALRMIDAIRYLDFDAGKFGKGIVSGVKAVNPEEWFFDAHFYQDPVCPGSLGVESFLQLLRYFLIQKYSITPDDYEVRMAEGHTHEWIYRGQIIPANKEIEIQAHISSCTEDEAGYHVTAAGAVTVDRICIYEMVDFSLALVRVRQHHTNSPADKVVKS